MKILLLFFLLGSVNALKFLAYSPQFAKSHVNFMGKISDILIDGGHEVVSSFNPFPFHFFSLFKVLLSPILDSSLGFAGTKKARIIEVNRTLEMG